MENEKLQISLAPGQDKAEIIIREVAVVNELPVKPPVRIAISGTIGAPLEFLTRRTTDGDQLYYGRCHALVNREKLTITLITNENDEYRRGSIVGELKMHPKFLEFGINTGKEWSPVKLGMFIKMNRAFFPDKKVNMDLVTQLMNFTAQVNNSIERSAKETGDKTDKFAQTVNSNLPTAFTLKIPVFIGKPAESLEVETFAQIDGREVSFALLSPAANEIIEEVRDTEIDTQLKAIREILPGIAIIEQ